MTSVQSLLEWKGHPWISLPLRWYLGGVFLYACYYKILSPGSFAIEIATYQILPLPLVNLQAIILPWVELAAGLMLILGFRTRAAALLVSGMLAMFTFAMVVALLKGIETSCGCFASERLGEHPLTWFSVVRDIGWMAMAGFILIFDHAPVGIDRIGKWGKKK